MLDKNVEINEGITLDQNTIVSCNELGTDSKGKLSFQHAKEAYEAFFEQGVICHMPMDLKLEPYQYMG